MTEPGTTLRDVLLRGVPVTVRTWRREDLPVVRDLALAIWRATYGSFIPDKDLVLFHTSGFSEEKLMQYVTDPDLCGMLALVAGRPVGFAKTMYAGYDAAFYLSSLYVLPEFQGGGIGKLMLDVSEEIAIQHGAREVWLGVMKQNEKALQWYLALGFEFVREEPFMMGETSVPHFIGYRTLRRQQE